MLLTPSPLSQTVTLFRTPPLERDVFYKEVMKITKSLKVVNRAAEREIIALVAILNLTFRLPRGG